MISFVGIGAKFDFQYASSYSRKWVFWWDYSANRASESIDNTERSISNIRSFELYLIWIEIWGFGMYWNAKLEEYWKINMGMCKGDEYYYIWKSMIFTFLTLILTSQFWFQMFNRFWLFAKPALFWLTCQTTKQG